MDDESKPTFSKLVCQTTRENEKFLLENDDAKRAYDLIFKLWNYCFEVQYKCMTEGPYSIWPMMLHVIGSKIYSMINAILLGDIPTVYMCMRVILEGAVDTAIIGVGRFLEEPFPKDLERLKKLERKKNISFNEKCELLLPSWVDDSTRENCKELWKKLSKYWLHSHGIIKTLQEMFESEFKRTGRAAPPPMWAMAIPYTYQDQDIRDLKKLADNLQELLHIIKVLFRPFEPKDDEST